MNDSIKDISCTIRIEQEDSGFSAYCESFKKIIEGPSALTYGKTPLEAAENAYKMLVALIEEEDSVENTDMDDSPPEKFEQAANNIAGLLDIRPSAQEIIRVHLCLFAIHIAEQMFPELTREEARMRALSIKDMPRATWNKEQQA